MTRRDAFRLLGAAGVTIAGCKSADEEAAAASAGDLNLFGSCGSYDRSGTPSSAPEELRKYEKVVILMMENRSFDHYFGHLSLPTELGGEGRTDVDGLTGSEVQYLANGGDRTAYASFAAQTYAIGDIDHEWAACHGQFNGGQMDGFIQMHFADLERKRLAQTANCGKVCAAVGDPMAYYTRKDTPVFHQLLDNYALCDRWFSSVMGPTWPNRFYLHAATSCGEKANNKIAIAKKPKDDTQARTIWHEASDKCVSAVNYSVDVAFELGGFGALNGTITNNVVFGKSPKRTSGPHDNVTMPASWENASFEEACTYGCLPTISVIDPSFVLAPCDDHPPHDVQAGQAFVASIYKLLTSNEEQWNKTLFIITYDEHGSFYDHVVPPSVAEDERPEFRQLGFRVPALVIGPNVKKNYVSHVQYDHVSFLSTISRRFGLTPLNARVSAANDVRDCIDRDALETASTPSPIKLASVSLSESRVHESIRNSRGQSELADIRWGGPATLEMKRRATSGMLGVFDRLGTANIRS